MVVLEILVGVMMNELVSRALHSLITRYWVIATILELEIVVAELLHTQSGTLWYVLACSVSRVDSFFLFFFVSLAARAKTHHNTRTSRYNFLLYIYLYVAKIGQTMGGAVLACGWEVGGGH